MHALNLLVFALPAALVNGALLDTRRAVNPDAVVDVKCLDPDAGIVFHDMKVAQLQICGGIAGPITKCEGRPQQTTGQSGTARFDLAAVEKDDVIIISKGRWAQCIAAARAVCQTGTMEARCAGGARKGDVTFKLTRQ